MSTILRGFFNSDIQIAETGLQIEYKTSKKGNRYFIIEVTDRNFAEFEGQVTDTINFLKQNKEQLLHLKENIPGLTWDIDFGYNPKVVTGELAVEGLHFPVELLAICTNLEIELLISLYNLSLAE